MLSSKYKKLIALVLIVSVFFVARPKPAQAGEWGGAMMAAIWKQSVETMVKSIQDTLLANVKMAAMRVIQNRMLSLLKTSSGSSSQGLAGMLIANWQSFVYSTAQNYATTVTSDFFTNLNTSANNYTKQYILTPASNALTENVFEQVPDIQEYIDDPTYIFKSNSPVDWKIWIKAAEPQNDLATTYLKAEALKQAAYQQKIQTQMAEGLAGSGYASKKKTSSDSKTSKYGSSRSSSGKDEEISLPGAMLNNFLNETQSMGIKLVTYAKSIPEVVANMVTTSITQMVNQGITDTFSKIK
ncbi:MAG: hypothetical protein PHF35_01465 [Candidatus Moranbacteria bacterium]|nr:hypothetical protein [Candidatus Moranbacteria bacterium]